MPSTSFIFSSLGIIICCLTGFASSIASIDYACFRGDTASSYVEIYAAVQRDGLVYMQHDDALQAAFEMILSVEFEGETMLTDTFAGVDTAVHRDSLKSGQFFPHVFQYFMKPGVYQLRASLFQYSELTDDPIRKELVVKSFGQDEFELSDIQFGCSLERTEAVESQYVKNNIRILPNPTTFYGTQLPMFYYYVEAYGLTYDSTAVDSITVFRSILRADSDLPARAVSQKVYKKTGTSAVIADGFPVYTLQTGSYKLQIRVLDYSTGLIAEQVKRFFCYRPDDFAQGNLLELDDEMKSQLAVSDLHILEIIDPDSAIELMHYLFDTKADEETVRAYNEEGKRKYLQTYWRDRELGEPNAANNYFARVAVANMRYGYFNKPGWRTDRGRIFITYGEPNEVVRNYEQADQTDHEIWIYEQLEGGVQFVFVDKTGFGVLELVHSTKKGEIKSPYWQSSSPSSIDVRDVRGNK
ncbi:GWxTD domain-containing protein [bacterium]|nr:MAG: GWxTD domain-containing protein [bacterium]